MTLKKGWEITGCAWTREVMQCVDLTNPQFLSLSPTRCLFRPPEAPPIQVGAGSSPRPPPGLGPEGNHKKKTIGAKIMHPSPLIIIFFIFGHFLKIMICRAKSFQAHLKGSPLKSHFTVLGIVSSPLKRDPQPGFQFCPKEPKRPLWPFWGGTILQQRRFV